jgi:hypothetical protein
VVNEVMPAQEPAWQYPFKEAYADLIEGIKKEFFKEEKSFA